MGGEEATRMLRSDKFAITRRLIGFSLNGWDRDPLRPNKRFLKDILTNEALRTVSPPTQDAFATRFWDVSDLIRREVYLMVIDSDNDALKKGGFTWISIDAI